MATGKKFAVFDIDGTLIRWQLYHAVSDTLVKLGFVDAADYDSIRTARRDWKTRGASFKSYEVELIRVYEEVLAKLTTAQLDKAVQDVFDEYRDQVYIYTRQLIAELKRNNYFLLAISGSQIEIVKLVAKHYGFDDYTGTIYERSEGSFSGQKSVPSRDKAKALRDMAAKHRLEFKDSLAVGDSLSDAAMLKLVEQPIAFNPDADLFKIANQNGWKIVLERKNMIYELEKINGQYKLVKTNR